MNPEKGSRKDYEIGDSPGFVADSSSLEFAPVRYNSPWSWSNGGAGSCSPVEMLTEEMKYV